MEYRTDYDRRIVGRAVSLQFHISHNQCGLTRIPDSTDYDKRTVGALPSLPWWCPSDVPYSCSVRGQQLASFSRKTWKPA